MDVRAAMPTDWATAQAPLIISSDYGEKVSVSDDASAVSVDTAFQTKDQEKSDEKNSLTKDDLSPIAKELNKILEYATADLQFELHDGTGQLIVKLVDVRENKVLREYPPKEMLDRIAKMREYIGMLLDKKA